MSYTMDTHLKFSRTCRGPQGGQRSSHPPRAPGINALGKSFILAPPAGTTRLFGVDLGDCLTYAGALFSPPVVTRRAATGSRLWGGTAHERTFRENVSQPVGIALLVTAIVVKIAAVAVLNLLC
ncbi:hypothetical protein BP00DRAFT_19738 [Aspergillus indologenus CBS 114.80]|uniref:Uncharacterized protein n=1 Tax=Aspergillus indologenus CBS 114.80 TaxID=1450541 RepID=A0A2V5IU33_9EURO|nr:hypothetical protein BP00DRAFT_19738 [Aspergillus indologenus CBS 114.80]